MYNNRKIGSARLRMVAKLLQVACCTLLILTLVFTDQGLNLATASNSSKGVLWYRTWGLNSTDYASSIGVDGSGNIYLAGSSNSTASENFNVLVLKYSPNGTLLWQRMWGDRLPVPYLASSIAVDSQGDAYVAGRYTFLYYPYGYPTEGSTILLMKFNPDGTLAWAAFPSTSSEISSGIGVAIGTSGELYVSGETLGSNGQTHQVLLRTDSGGTMQWERDWITQIALSSIAVDSKTDDIYLVGGINGTSVLKFNSSGSMLWQETLSGPKLPSGYAVRLNPQGELYIAGALSTGNRTSAILLLKLNSDGALEWQKGWTFNGYESATGVAIGDSGSIFVSGYTTAFSDGSSCYVQPYFRTNCPDVFLLELNSTGDIQSRIVWGGVGDDAGLGVVLNPSGDAFVTGYVGEASLYSNVTVALTSVFPNLSIQTSSVVTSNYTGGTGYILLPANALSGQQTFAGGRDVFLLKYGTLVSNSSQPLNPTPLSLSIYAIAGFGLTAGIAALVVVWRKISQRRGKLSAGTGLPVN